MKKVYREFIHYVINLGGVFLLTGLIMNLLPPEKWISPILFWSAIFIADLLLLIGIDKILHKVMRLD